MHISLRPNYAPSHWAARPRRSSARRQTYQLMLSLSITSRMRFGTDSQGALFKAQLRAHKRGNNETLQVLYQDISRLVALAYPGPESTHSDALAVDAFIDTIDDEKLELRIRDRELRTLDDAFKATVMLEANQKDLLPQGLWGRLRYPLLPHSQCAQSCAFTTLQRVWQHRVARRVSCGLLHTIDDTPSTNAEREPDIINSPIARRISHRAHRHQPHARPCPAQPATTAARKATSHASAPRHVKEARIRPSLRRTLTMELRDAIQRFPL